ncbi:MAG: DNA mismatch repair endonuclease MutL [Blautia sp.]
MGREIAVLDQNTIDKIAAGEVVERPSSVVKELVENAIDAGSTAVTVEIKDGGKSLIRITDNGSGIPANQVRRAFLRHATSKIEKVEDLVQIVSLGFRGEALSSIAAVSQVELITKTPSAMSGVRYVIEGGVEKALEEIGAPEGSTFLVRNLFFNTPARSKFLKTDTTEAGYVSTLMEQMALSHPEISFKYIQNGQVKLHTSGNYSRKDVIYHIYGRNITKELLEVHVETDLMTMDGFVGRPVLSRGNRNFENYYINGRYVKDKIITRAIEDAYKGFLMQHQFPFAVLEIRMEGNDLDVNVHPSKMEVRFSRGSEVYETISHGILEALQKREMIPEVELDKKPASLPKKTWEKAAIPEPFEVRQREKMGLAASSLRSLEQGSKEKKAPERLRETSAYHTDPVNNKLPASQPATPPIECMSQKPDETSAAGQNQTLPKPEKISVSGQPSSPPQPENSFKKPAEEAAQMELFDEPMLSQEARIRHRLIGQVFETYWLVEYDGHFYIIDQHAAHEKVLYERLVKAFKEQNILSQYVSPPIIVTLNLQEIQILESHMELFTDFGFEIRPFGGKEYSIDAVPANLYGLTREQVFTELLDQLADGPAKPTMDIFAGRLATMACKAAVKGNHAMSMAEADQLIDELLTLENPYHCPHGRPTIISMSKTELEKKFKRIV